MGATAREGNCVQCVRLHGKGRVLQFMKTTDSGRSTVYDNLQRAGMVQPMRNCSEQLMKIATGGRSTVYEGLAFAKDVKDFRECISHQNAIAGSMI